MKEHDLPNEWDYFDPAKADEKREWATRRLGWKGGGDEMSSYHLDHLAYLETEAIHVLREVAAEFERPAVLFSGGKDSICILRLAEKAFRPSRFRCHFSTWKRGMNFRS